jgi:hypothetical protein
MAYGTVNADVIGTSVANSNLGAGNATRFKNRIINGDMRIDQRNAGASKSYAANSAAEYSLDRWNGENKTDGTFTIQQLSTAPSGFINSLGLTVTSTDTSIGATQYAIVSQGIEGLNIADLAWGTASAKTVTLSFQVYSSLTGTFGGVLTNSAQTRTYPFTYTVSSANTWTSISITVAGDTSGTWLTTNGAGIFVIFGLACGSTYSGTAGSWAGTAYLSATGAQNVMNTNGSTWYITGVQLEVGSSATGFEYVDQTSQLAMCQRYYTTSYGIGVAIGTATVNGLTGASYCYSAGSGVTSSWIGFPVQMRTSATISYWDSAGTVNKASQSTGSSSSWSNNANLNVGPYAGSPAGFQFQGDAGNANRVTAFQYAASAEL